MKYLLLASVLVFHINSDAQKQNEMLSIAAGPSFHGSGDMPGLHFNFEYRKYFRKKLYYAIDVAGHIHNDQYYLFYTTPDGVDHDGSVRTTVAGLQLGGGIGYNIVRTFHHDLSIKTSAFYRYQSSPLYDVITVLFEPATGLPFPVVILQHKEAQKKFSPGMNIQLSYRYYVSKKYSIGIYGSFQFDTNEDNIMNAGLSIGRRF